MVRAPTWQDDATKYLQDIVDEPELPDDFILDTTGDPLEQVALALNAIPVDERSPEVEEVVIELPSNLAEVTGKIEDVHQKVEEIHEPPEDDKPEPEEPPRDRVRTDTQ